MSQLPTATMVPLFRVALTYTTNLASCAVVACTAALATSICGALAYQGQPLTLAASALSALLLWFAFHTYNIAAPVAAQQCATFIASPGAQDPKEFVDMLAGKRSREEIGASYLNIISTPMFAISVTAGIIAAYFLNRAIEEEPAGWGKLPAVIGFLVAASSVLISYSLRSGTYNTITKMIALHSASRS